MLLLFSMLLLQRSPYSAAALAPSPPVELATLTHCFPGIISIVVLDLLLIGYILILSISLKAV